MAFRLGVQAGLRREEIASVTSNDFTHAPDGFLRVWNDYAKRGKYRETPIPKELASSVRTLSYERDPDEPIVDVEPNSIYRWVKRAGERRYAATGDEGWTFLDVHDLRRTWGGHLLWDCGVLPAVVMSWGGWEDWPTFRDSYLGEMSPATAERERGKISYVSGGRGGESDSGPVFRPTVETASPY
ncbi:site-specific integrase [Halorubrum ezzemoulense]|uniref:Site-specific integrase n=1 Tax=Halorubrum ezzemoulense TaxID=337243 RepID=A0ABT4Z7K7_HALEZ|nr:site-specific integrase [Halorubrum ezzemoulense]MDB2283489.1 site-specific integrase [Halorubrum ezzemoulense]MDB2294167.1 site-specific integrase [Halorubrum ezzemoulense]MDB9281644.1 site-specific integrase [Halorubrum ezzemoulense]MDB9285184.1 site-specific integrase [Halorubrum ezzemoulense]